AESPLKPAVLATATATSTATRRPTPTWTSFPTATQVAASPLLTRTTVITLVVPLPEEYTGPDLAPEATITTSLTITPTLAPTATASAPFLLIPTPTPTPTRTITEALAAPVVPGGMAGIVATATAVAPV